MKVRKYGEWDELRRILDSLPKRLPGAMKYAVNAEAQSLRGHMIKNISSGGTHAGKPFAPLSAATIIIRKFTGFGGTKPLNVTGGLRTQISVVNYAGGVFIGIKRGAPHKSGVANLAFIHEFGATINVNKTRKMVRFLAAAFRSAGQSFGSGGSGKATITIRIPPRPFVSPVLEKYAQPDDVVDRFWTRVSARLAGDLGRP